MVNTQIRLIIFFAAKDGEALYSQQKQDWEWTVAQIMNSLLQNSDLNWRKEGKPLDHSGMTSIKSLMIIQGKWGLGTRSDRQSAWWTMEWDSWHCTGERDQDQPHGKEMQKNNMAVWGGLTNSCGKRSKSKGEKERYKHQNAEFQRIARRDKKPSSVINAKK